MTYSGNQFVLFANGWLNERTINREIVYIKKILGQLHTPEQFSRAFELVDRNRIRYQSKKIIRELLRPSLRPFRFFIGKN